MKKVLIKCPRCSKTKFIQINENDLKANLSGIIVMNIKSNIICSHNFIVYIDQNLQIRDYFVVDFNIEFPEITLKNSSEIDSIISKEFIFDIELIKLNLLPMILAYIIKSIFLNQKIVLICDQKFLHSHISNFFKFITQKSFKTDIIIITTETYERNKNIYKDSMVFGQNKILNNASKLIKPKKLSIEKQIVSKFIAEEIFGNSYKVLRNEILKAYELSKVIVDLINKHKEKNEEINILKINDELKKLFGIKIDNFYLTFLIEIVNNYFKVPIPSFSDSFIKTL